MKNKLLLVLSCLLLGFAVTAQTNSAYEKHWLVQGKDSLPYRLLLPENYDASKKYPLVFFMHGAGERGNNNEAQLMHGAKLFMQADVRKQYPAIVVFPQCSRESFWAAIDYKRDSLNKPMFNFNASQEPSIAMKLANTLLHEIIAKYPVQKKKIYVGGLSMGGMGTFEIVARNPGLFAAAFPICGGGDPSTAKKLKKTNWWVFHGAKDDVVPPAYSQEMVSALQAGKAKVKFTLYPNANHNSWDAAFAEPELLPWLFSQKK